MSSRDEVEAEILARGWVAPPEWMVQLGMDAELEHLLDEAAGLVEPHKDDL